MDIEISTEEFQRFRTLIYDESGISLNDQKQGLVASRLSKRLRELGVKTFSDYYDRLMHDTGREEFTRMLDLISTNKTDFFREPKHFDYLREEILPQLAREKKIRIWSSASSTGEEPYTIAMTLYDGVADPANWDFKILASDLSTRVLAKAAGGVYDADRVDDMPPDVVRRHFLRGKGEHEGRLKVKPHLTSMVRFQRINLMDDHFPIKSPLDLIFCRNVMIYFDAATQRRVLERTHAQMAPGSLLFVGHSENFTESRDLFELRGKTIYQRV